MGRVRRGLPKIATLAHDRFAKDQVVMVGTLRKEGSSRISPCEPDFVDGRLMLGMMWRSKKALDLLRDPRIAVHRCTSDRMGTQGDIKLYGRAVEVQDRSRAAARLPRGHPGQIDWAPEEPARLSGA